MELTTKDWKEFRIGDLFSVETCKGVDAGSLCLNKNYSENTPYEFIGRTNDNYGLQGYIGDLGFPVNNSETITISQVGTIVAQIRTSEYYTSQNIFKLTALKFESNQWNLLFIVTMLNKILLRYTGYASYPTQKSLRNEMILLPSKNDEPDWDFMEEFIKRIEEENKEKLAVLKDVKPVDDEIDISDWHEFRVGDLFETLGGKRVPTGSYVKKAVLDANLGQIPRITVTGLNNGIDGYYNESINDSNYRIYENFISVTFLGDCFYQKHKASLDMKVHCLKLLDIDLNEKIALFLITTLKKEMLTYNYGDQLNSENLKDIILKLPSKNDQPDWEYMEDFITNQQEKIKNQLKELR